MKGLTMHHSLLKAIGRAISLSSFSSSASIYLFAMIVSALSVTGLKAQNLDVPFVPTSEAVVEVMLDLVNVGPGDYVIDLGSGDGRIVIAAAKRGAVGHGIDIDPKRIREARGNAEKEGVEDHVLFIQEDLFQTDFSRASVVTMYLLNSVNLKLRPHLLENLRPGTRIVSHDFDMGEWKPDEYKKEGYSDVYYWVIPADVKGNWNWESDGNGYTLSVGQNFQQIDVNLRRGNKTYKVQDSVLSGERISFTAIAPNNDDKLVFSGRVDGNNIIGTVQKRKGDDAAIEKWNATRK